MADIQPGYTYGDSPNNVVNATNINQHVGSAVILPDFISLKSLKDPAALSDEMVINDAGVLKKVTLQQLKALIGAAIAPGDLTEEARMPAGAILDYAGAAAPVGWLFCFGQLVSRTTHARLFSAIGTIYGVGDGSTTFGIPDFRGRVGAGKDNMGGTSAARLSDSGLVGHGVVGTTLGDAGGSQSHTLAVGELAAHAHTFNDYYQASGIAGGGGNIESGTDLHLTEVGATLANGTAATGSSVRHNNVQPTIIMNKIIRYA